MSICNLLKNKISLLKEKIHLLNPIINVYIFNIMSIENPLRNSQKKFDLIAKQKFGKLYFSNDGIIYPNSYSYESTKYNFTMNDIYNNKRVYTSDILSSNLLQRGGNINNLRDFYKFYQLHLTKELKFVNKTNFYIRKRINDIVVTINDATYIT